MALSSLVTPYVTIKLSTGDEVQIDKLLLKDWEEMLRMYTGLVYRLVLTFDDDSPVTNKVVKDELPVLCCSILMDPDIQETETLLKFLGLFIKKEDLLEYLKGLSFEDFELVLNSIYEANTRPFSFQLRKLVTSGALTKEAREKVLAQVLQMQLNEQENEIEDSSTLYTEPESTPGEQDLQLSML